MRWVAFISIVGAGSLFLARLVAFTLHVSHLPQNTRAPGWVLPHLVQVLFVIDGAVVIGLAVLGVVLLRMDSE